jgi:hypothetical protein
MVPGTKSWNLSRFVIYCTFRNEQVYRPNKLKSVRALSISGTQFYVTGSSYGLRIQLQEVPGGTKRVARGPSSFLDAPGPV